MKTMRAPLLLFVLPALLLAQCPAAQAILVYQRDDILRGELWRLWTGHWVHFSASHLFWNALVLFFSGTFLEKLRPRLLVPATFLAAPAISALLLFFAPQMTTYGGLSGIAMLVFTLVALVQLRDAPRNPAIGVAMLVLVAAKLLHEALRSDAIFAHFDSASIHSSFAAHLFGTALAFLFLRKSSNLTSETRTFCSHYE